MSHLILERVYYPVITLGYGNRLGVWVRGCSRACPGCISQELLEGTGEALAVEELIKRIPSELDVDGLTISGGEPFDQAEGIADLIRWFKGCFGTDILVFTGYTYEELIERNDSKIKEILDNIAVLVDGPYIDSLNNGVGLRGSLNQRIIVKRHNERYRDAEHWRREVQFIGNGNSLLQIGIPPKNID